MKWKTAWHGTFIIAENNEDEDVLQALYFLLPNKATKAHEDGDMMFITPKTYFKMYFEITEDYEENKTILYFRR